MSVERIIGELDKLLLAHNPQRGLDLLHDTGLLNVFLPEVTPERFTLISNLPLDSTIRAAGLLAETELTTTMKRLRELRYSKERISTIQQVIDGAQRILKEPSGDSDYRRWYHMVGEAREASYQIAKTLSDNAEDIWAKMEETRIRLGNELNDFSLPITGHEIIELLEVEEGEIIGEALQYLQNLRFDQGPFSNSDARNLLQDWWTTKTNESDETNAN